jgi:transcriptional regulator with XRE-family HTH domain
VAIVRSPGLVSSRLHFPAEARGTYVCPLNVAVSGPRQCVMMGGAMSGPTARTNRLAETRARRGLSQGQLVAALRRTARERGQDELPPPRTLQQQVSRWENGRQSPGDRYRELLTSVLGCSDVELGLALVDDDEEPFVDDDFDSQSEALVAGLARSGAVLEETIGAFRTTTDYLRLRDREGGAEHLLHQLRGHQGMLEAAMRYSLSPGLRTALATVLADTAALHAWHALDMGQLMHSWAAFDTAEASAKLAANPAVGAFVAAERAFALVEIGKDDEARQLMEHVHQRASRKVPALLASWLSAARAEVLAANGEDRACRRALDLAAGRLAAADPVPELPFLVLDDHHLGRWQGHCLARLGDSDAIARLETSLFALDLSFVRARAGALVDLATALAFSGDLAEADIRLRQARLLALQAGSGRQLRRIERLRQEVGLGRYQAV